MEGIKEEAIIHHTALKLAEEIKNLSIYKSFYSDVQVRINTKYYVYQIQHTQSYLISSNISYLDYLSI